MTSNYETKENRNGHWVIFSTRWETEKGANYPLTVYATKAEADAKIASWNAGNIY